jgi:hypothetical protein
MAILKHSIAIILLSFFVITTMAYAQHALEFLVAAHDWVADVLTQVFSGGTAGDLTRKLIALLAVPLLIGLIPALIYWIIKRSWFPHFMQLVWVVWLVQVAALIVVFQTGSV